MEERIQINGVWYVKENNQKEIESENLLSFNVLESKNLTIEENSFLLEGTKLYLEDDDFSIYISYRDKLNNNEDFWDNEEWIVGVSKREEESINELRKGDLRDFEQKAVIQLIDKMNELKWFE